MSLFKRRAFGPSVPSAFGTRFAAMHAMCAVCALCALCAALPARAQDGAADTAALELPEAAARATRRPTEAQKHHALEGAALDRRLGRSLGDALTAVEGVTLLQSGPTISKPEIHGLQGNRIQVLNNGVKLEGQQWGSEHAPEVDPFLAGSLEVVKGAAGVRYGPEALGGVVLVTPRPLRTTPGSDGEWHALLTTAGRGGATALRYDVAPEAVPGLALRVQGSVRRLGDQEAPRYVLANTALSEQNGSAAVGYGGEHYHAEVFYSRFHTKLGILRAAHIGNLADLEAALERDVPEETGPFGYDIDRPRQEVTHDLVKVRGGRHWDAGHLDLSYAFQNNDRSEYDKHRSLNDSVAALDRPELRFTIYTHRLEAVFDRAARGGFSGQYGMAAGVQGNASHGRTFVPNFINASGGAFALERWNGEHWGAEAGLRYDHRLLQVFRNPGNGVVQTNFENGGLSAALGGTWRSGNEEDGTLEARANLSSAWRPPAANELYSNGVHHGAAAVEYGDTSLKAEKAYSAALSLSHRANADEAGLREVEAEVYATYIHDYIGLVPEQPPTLTIRGAFPTFRYQAGNMLLRGLDARAAYAVLPWLEAGTRASLLWAGDVRTGDGLLFSPAHRWENSLTATRGNWRGLRDLFASARAQAVFRQGNPAPNDYAPAPPGYVLFGAEAGFTWASPAGAVDVELQARNLLNETYRDYTNRFRYYADETGREIAVRVKLAFGN
jgi:iron complex outermembrane receptor protein